MAPDEFQQAWQTQTVQTHVTINTDQLRNEVQRSQQNFRTMINGRDSVEIIVSLVMIPLWFYWGSKGGLPWTWYLTVPALFWVLGFVLIDRKRHPRTISEPGETLVECVTESLEQVEHQIWLLRNVFWWYLLPFTVSIMAFFTQTCWQSSAAARADGINGWWEFVASLSGFGVFLLVIYGFIYFLNQRAVRQQLVPQREELTALLERLGDETTGDSVDEIDIPVMVSPFAENGFIRGAGGTGVKPPKPAIRVAIGLLALAMLMVLILAANKFCTPASTDAASRGTDIQSHAVDEGSLAALVSRHRADQELVGLAAMVMVDGIVTESGVDGERKVRSGVALDMSDQWHINFVTCAINATMIASLVESGQLNWTTTVGEVFADGAVHEDWQSVTLKQLLTHTSGAPNSFSSEVKKHHPAFGAEAAAARNQAVIELIASEKTTATGSFGISSVGPTIAGAMAERATAETWSNLVRQIVFQPLALSEAGFGPPRSSPDSPESPRGHRTLSEKSNAKYSLSDKTDNTAIVGPAFGVHMTLRDLCIFGTEHLRGYFREGQLLSAETYRVLHTPELRQHACGWVRRKPDDKIAHTVYWHNGSNTLWYAFVAFVPERNMVFAVAANDGDISSADAAAWDIVQRTLNRTEMLAEMPAEEVSGRNERSPFTAIRWQGSRPEVQLDGDWYRLISLNELSAMEIVEFSQRIHGDQWQKRFAEDLVALLTRMGHPPAATVTLKLRSLTNNVTTIRERVPMTKANRNAIRDLR